MSLSESLQNVPKWIKEGSEIWQDREDFDENQNLYLYDFPIRNMKDFKNILKSITFWKIKSPYPYQLWEFIFNEKYKNEIQEYLTKNVNELNGYLSQFANANSDKICKYSAKNGEIECLR